MPAKEMEQSFRRTGPSYEEMDEFVTSRLPRLEKLARQRFMGVPLPSTKSDHELLLEIRDSLQNLENRLSARPGLIITGNAVTEEWEKLTRRHR